MKRIGVVIHTALRDALFDRDDIARLDQLGEVFWTESPEPISLAAACELLAAREFAAMRDGAVFINTARGRCIDRDALIRELRAGRLFAFLDVTNPEPAPADCPLRSLPNVMLTGHIAGPQAKNMGRQAVDDIAAFLSGGKPMCVVGPEQLDRIA